MKHAITLLALVFLCGVYSVNATESKPTPVDAPIMKVTVYPGQAKITRVASLDLEAGEHSLQIEHLPNSIDKETFSVSAAGAEDALILGLRHRQAHHLKSPEEKVVELEQQMKQLEREELQVLNDHLQTFKEQKSLLKALTETAGKQMGKQATEGAMDVTQWEAAYDFVGDKHMLTDDSIRQTQFALNDVNEQYELLDERHGDLIVQRFRTSTSVTIDLRLEKAGQVTIALDYVIPGASWKPIYDARLSPDSNKVELSYFAEVTQRTGEDWQNVELTLSTASPSRGTGPGELLGWFLSIPEQVRSLVDDLLDNVAGVQSRGEGEVFIRGSRAGEVAYIVDGVPIGDPLGGSGSVGANLSLVSGSIMESCSFNTAFRIKRKETVLSDNQAVRTPIAQYELEASPRFICRPSNRKDAFRVMSLTNQDKAPLMPGMVSIFVGSSYIGRAALAGMILPREEFEIGFGPDNSFKVARDILDLKTTHKPGKTRTEQTVEITLVNHGLESREVLLEEPIPVSQDSRIKIKLGDITPETDKPDALGIIRWNLTLLPGEEKIVRVSYRIEHPRGLQVQGL